MIDDIYDDRILMDPNHVLTSLQTFEEDPGKFLFMNN